MATYTGSQTSGDVTVSTIPKNTLGWEIILDLTTTSRVYLTRAEAIKLAGDLNETLAAVESPAV